MFDKIRKIFNSKNNNVENVKDVSVNVKEKTNNTNEVYHDANDKRLIQESIINSREYERVKGKNILVSMDEIKELTRKMNSYIKNKGGLRTVYDEETSSYVPKNNKRRYNPAMFNNFDNEEKSYTDIPIGERDYERNHTRNQVTCNDLGNPNKVLEEFEIDRFPNLGAIIKSGNSSSFDDSNPYTDY